MADNGPRILRRTRGIAALPVRFTAQEQRQATLEQRQAALEERQAALEAQLPVAQAAALEAFRATLGEGLGELRGALFAELGRLQGELVDLRRLVEECVAAEAESAELIGKLLQRAEARLDALEGHGV